MPPFCEMEGFCVYNITVTCYGEMVDFIRVSERRNDWTHTAFQAGVNSACS